MPLTSHTYQRHHNGITYTVNYYGKLPDTEVIEYVMTSIGIIEIKLYWTFLNHEMVICADMYCAGEAIGPMSSVTKFRSVVHLRNGQIIEKIRGCNAFWVEVEYAIVNVIAANE